MATRIDLVEFLVAAKHDDAVVLDVRPKKIHDYAYIPGALNWDAGQTGTPLAPALRERLESASIVIIYANAASTKLLDLATKGRLDNSVRNIHTAPSSSLFI